MATRRTVEKAPDGAEKITTKQTMLQGRPGSSTPLWPLHWPVILGEGLKFENSELDPVGIETPCTWHDDRSAFFGRFTMDNLFHVMHHAIPSHAFMEAVLPAVAERATVDALPCPYFWNKRDVYHMWSWRLFVAGLGLPADTDALVNRSHALIGTRSCHCYPRVFGGHSQIFGPNPEPTLFGTMARKREQLVRFRSTVGRSFGVLPQQPPRARLIFVLRHGNRVILNERELQDDVARDPRLSGAVTFAQMERIPVAAQAALIYDARAIAGMHGQGLTWTAFLPTADGQPGACLEMHPPGCSHSCKTDYRDLSHLNGVRYGRLELTLANNCPKKWETNWRMCGNVTADSGIVRDVLSKMIMYVRGDPACANATRFC